MLDQAGKPRCTELTAPPRPRLALRVGIVGHRPKRLKRDPATPLEAVLHSILGAVREEVLDAGRELQDVFAEGPPRLTALSPLAEGTDRDFARAALALKYELCCVMPFARAEYEHDFEPRTPDGRDPRPTTALEAGALEDFHALLGQATRCFELDGLRTHEPAAYAAAGRVVLAQSDLLVVVWDGERLGLGGGAEEIHDAARRAGVPVALVHAHAPHGWRMLAGPATTAVETPVLTTEPDAERQLRQRVRQLLDPPPPERPVAGHAEPGLLRSLWTLLSRRRVDPREQLRQFLAEEQPRHTRAVVWSCFRSLFGDGQLPVPDFRVQPFEEAVLDEWPDTPAQDTGGGVVPALRPFYAWSDRPAVLHADRYRSTFIIGFFLAALAVGLALLPQAIPVPEHDAQPYYAAELGLIALVLGLVVLGLRRRSHKRWLDERLVAELLRHLRIVAPLGGARPFPQVPAHWTSYGNPAQTWMAWYVRAVERDLGLPAVVVDRAYVAAELAHLKRLIEGQIGFHARTAKRSARIEQRLHRLGMLCLILTLVCCVLHLVGVPWPSGHWLTFFCGFLPALGAASAGIGHQGEFRRIERRSEAMATQLEIRLARVEEFEVPSRSPAASPTQALSRSLLGLADDTARLMVNEVLDWRVVFLDQPLRPPA